VEIVGACLQYIERKDFFCQEFILHLFMERPFCGLGLFAPTLFGVMRLVTFEIFPLASSFCALARVSSAEADGVDLSFSKDASDGAVSTAGAGRTASPTSIFCWNAFHSQVSEVLIGTSSYDASGSQSLTSSKQFLI
jgi:hypothetical protein